MPNTFDITLNTNGFGFKDESWGGNAFEGDILSFSLNGLTGPITVSVYAGRLDSIPPGTPTSDAFLQVGNQGAATVTVDTGTSQAQLAVGASAQGQYFTLAYTTSGQPYVQTLSVNTFLGMGTSDISPPSVKVVEGAILYFENATSDTLHLKVEDKHGKPSSKLFGSTHFDLSSQGDQPETVTQRAVNPNSSAKTYQLTQASGRDTGSTISIKVGTSNPGTGGVEEDAA